MNKKKKKNKVLTKITSEPLVESFFNITSPNDLDVSSIIGGSGPP